MNAENIPEVVREYIDQCSNWGRWGDDDQIGTLNFVGPDEVRRAASLVRTGEVVPLSLPYDKQGCQDGSFRQNPQLLMTATGTDPIDAAIDGDALNPPHVLSVPYGLSLDLEIDLGKNLRGVDCRTHQVFVNGGVDGAKRTVTFVGGIADMNRDLVLNLELAKEQQPFALAATSAAGTPSVGKRLAPITAPPTRSGSLAPTMLAE